MLNRSIKFDKIRFESLSLYIYIIKSIFIKSPFQFYSPHFRCCILLLFGRSKRTLFFSPFFRKKKKKVKHLRALAFLFSNYILNDSSNFVIK